MRPAAKKHTVRSVILVLLLAAVCVGACELAFCRFADPQLYHAVVDPVAGFCRRTGRRAAEQARAAAALAGDGAQAAVRRLGVYEQALVRQMKENARRAEARQAALRRAGTMPAGETLEEPDAVPMAALPEIPAPSSAVSLVWEDGRELLTGGKFPVVYYNQSDPAWAGQLFGRDPIGGYGCGPTAMAMVVSTLTGETVDPAAMAWASARSGFCSPGNGSSLAIVPGMSAQYGLDCVSLPVRDAAALADALSGGGLVVALMGPGYFTRGGHFMVLHSLTEDGRVLVADSNSRVNSLTPWDLSFLQSELSAGRGSGAPLWLITAPASKRG